MIGELHHSGVYVEDLDRTVDELTAAFGLSWADPIDMTMAMATPAGLLEQALRVTFSLNGPAPIELLEEIGERAWTSFHGRPLHHLCFAVHDLAAALETVRLSGYSVDMWQETDGVRHGAALLTHEADGQAIELIDVKRRHQIDRWLAAERARHGLPAA